MFGLEQADNFPNVPIGGISSSSSKHTTLLHLDIHATYVTYFYREGKTPLAMAAKFGNDDIAEVRNRRNITNPKTLFVQIYLSD